MAKRSLFLMAPLLSFNSFVDSYTAWDFNRPESRERTFTTQTGVVDAARINLAMAGLRLDTDRTHTVFVGQWGDSVDLNYVAETQKGAHVKYLQEAYTGYKFSNDWWLDGGIYIGHIGNENWISKYNYTYSRAMQLDYVPYYTAGLRLSGKNWQVHLMNGWQRINEDNHGKAIGTQYVWSTASGVVTYNTQVGHEVFLTRQTSGLRTYQNLHWEIPGPRVSWKGAWDLGTQNVPGEHRAIVWAATSSQWQWKYSDGLAHAARIEYFHDQRGAVVTSRRPGGFRVIGTSTNVDYTMNEHLLWRCELKQLRASEALYPRHRHTDTLVVLSLGLTFDRSAPRD